MYFGLRKRAPVKGFWELLDAELLHEPWTQRTIRNKVEGRTASYLRGQRRHTGLVMIEAKKFPDTLPSRCFARLLTLVYMNFQSIPAATGSTLGTFLKT